MRSLRFVRILMKYVLCMVFIMGVFFQGTAFAKLHHKDMREQIAAYLFENQEALLEKIDELESWSETYYRLIKCRNEPGLIEGEMISNPHHRVPVDDDAVKRFFAENEIIFDIKYPVNSDIIVFETVGYGNATASMETGFYYSPQDTPAWINSEMLRHYKCETGEYLNYPMIQDGEGWAADKSGLWPYNNAGDDPLKSYGLYTDQICVNFFYFESWY